MYAACGAVSKADHEKLQTDLQTAEEATKETKEDLKKETKSRKDAEKKAETTEAEIVEIRDAKEKLDAEKKNLAKDAEKKGTELDKVKKQLDKLKADLDAEKSAAEEVRAELAAAKERAEQAEAELQAKKDEAAALAEEAEKVKEQAEEQIQEVMKQEEALEGELKKEELKLGPVWSSGLCKCCAKPGGIGLCLKAFCCPCLLMGRMNASLKLDGSAPCPGGCFGGCCLGCCCQPCYMRSAGSIVASKGGKNESKGKAFLCGCCCPCCYLTQVYRETLILAEGGPGVAPLQQTMGEGGEGGDGAAKATPSGGGGVTWSTGLCKCCAKPGGFKLCCKATCCPCLITKSLNNYLKEQEKSACCAKCGGCGGCCMGCACLPCFMRKAGPGVASIAGFEKQDTPCKACMKGCCCPSCYLCQVQREYMILTESG